MASNGAERVIRVDKVRAGMFSGNGWLTLTDQRLVFGTKERLGEGEQWSIPIGQIESARAKKAFRKGVEVLEVTYRSASGKREQRSFERMSWAQWANPTGRVEQNSFASFEQAVFAARDAAIRPQAEQSARAGASDVAAQLDRLAELHRTGVLSDEEFTAAKARVLG
jgi:hypothetical protein